MERFQGAHLVAGQVGTDRKGFLYVNREKRKIYLSVLEKKLDNWTVGSWTFRDWTISPHPLYPLPPILPLLKERGPGGEVQQFNNLTM
jgi:hypothetical protein